MVKTAVCLGCGQTFTQTQRGRKYCSHACNVRSYHGHDASIPLGNRGAIPELIASADLLSKGFEVFRSVSAHASCDLIAHKAGRFWRVEVRTGYRKQDGTISLPIAQRDKGRYDILAVYIPKERQLEYVPPLPEGEPE